MFSMIVNRGRDNIVEGEIFDDDGGPVVIGATDLLRFQVSANRTLEIEVISGTPSVDGSTLTIVGRGDEEADPAEGVEYTLMLTSAELDDLETGFYDAQMLKSVSGDLFVLEEGSFAILADLVDE